MVVVSRANAPAVGTTCTSFDQYLYVIRDSAEEIYCDFVSGDPEGTWRSRLGRFDADGDGDPNSIRCWDWDGDGDADDEDIQGCIDDCTGTGGCLVELIAGVYEIDKDDDGEGEHGYCSVGGREPHVCIRRSNFTLRGAGSSATILRKSTTTLTNMQEYVRVNEGSASARSTALIENVRLEGMSAEGPGCVTGTTNGKGFRFVDCDRCAGHDLGGMDLTQSVIDMARCRWSSFSDSWGLRTGNYDDSCTTPTAQPCAYAFTNDGVVAVGNTWSNIRCDGSGSPAFNFRADDAVTTVIGEAQPYPETALVLDTSAELVAQTFALSGSADTTPAGIVLPMKRDSDATGSIRIRIETISGSDATGTSVADFDDCDADATPPCFTVVPVGDLPVGGFDRIVFRRDLSAGYGSTRLTLDGPTGPDYAVVIEATVANGKVYVAHDGSGTTDTYTAGSSRKCDTLSGGTCTGTWSATGDSSSDIGMQVLMGWHDHPEVVGFTAADSTGTDGSEPICMTINATEAATVTGLSCKDAGTIRVGVDEYAAHTRLMGWNSSWDKSRTDPSAGHAMKLGVHAQHSTIADGTVNGGFGSEYGIVVGAYTRDVVIRGNVLRGIGGPTIALKDGVDRVTIDGNLIVDGGSDGILFAPSGSGTVNGVDGQFDDIRISGNTIERTKQDGIAASAGSVDINMLLVTENNFYDIGRHAVYLNLGTQTLGPFVFRGNLFHGWARDSVEPAVEDVAVFVYGNIDPMVWESNVYISTGGQEESYGYWQTATGANRWSWINERGIGSIASGDPWRLINTVSASSFSSFNVIPDASWDSYNLTLAITPDGKIRFGSGAAAIGSPAGISWGSSCTGACTKGTICFDNSADGGGGNTNGLWVCEDRGAGAAWAQK